MRKNEDVKYININSTLARHFTSSATKLPADHLLISGSERGKALMICNRIDRKGWELEYEQALHVLRQLGLQVKLSTVSLCL